MSWNVTGGVANNPGAPRVQFGFGRNAGWFEVELVQEDRVISSPDGSLETRKDRIEGFFEAGEIAEDYQVLTSVLPRPLDDGTPPSVTLTDGGGLEQDANDPDYIKAQAHDVWDTISVSTPQRTVRFPIHSKIRTDGPSGVIFQDFVEGSFAHHCDAAIMSRVAATGGATSAMKDMYVDYSESHADGSYEWNPNCWAYDLRDELSCISLWNSNLANRKAGTAFTPRHIGGVAHYEYPVGTVVGFLDGNGVFHTRTIIRRRRHPDYAPYYPDITMYLLDSDLPASVVPCKFLPSDFADYLPTGPQYIGTIGSNQEGRALITDMLEFSKVWISFGGFAKAAKRPLSQRLVLGDSGNPVFLVVNGDLVCVTLWTMGGSGAGNSLTLLKSDINQMISDLDSAAGISTGYTLETADLSSFPIVF